MAQLNCIVVTPEKTAIETTTDFVVVPLYDGELGIAPGHSPTIGRLGYGELRLGHGDKAIRYYVDGGFVQILNDTVSVLTNRAVPATDVDEGAAKDQLRHALKRPIVTKEQLEIRERLLAQARAQIHVAHRNKLGGARLGGALTRRAIVFRAKHRRLPKATHVAALGWSKILIKTLRKESSAPSKNGALGCPPSHQHMALPSTDRLLLPSRHSDSAYSGRRIVGLIAIDESFACRIEAQGQEFPWEVLVAEWCGDSSTSRCDQIDADVDQLAQDLAAEFAAIVGPSPSEMD